MLDIIPWASTSSVPTNQLNDNFISQISAEILSLSAKHSYISYQSRFNNLFGRASTSSTLNPRS